MDEEVHSTLPFDLAFGFWLRYLLSYSDSVSLLNSDCVIVCYKHFGTDFETLRIKVGKRTLDYGMPPMLRYVNSICRGSINRSELSRARSKPSTQNLAMY